MVTKLTNKIRKFKREDTGEVVVLYQLKAVKDFKITILDGKEYKTRYIRKGTLGGYVEGGVFLEEYSWVDQDAILFGNTIFHGVCCGYARIYDSIIGKGTIIAGRSIINDSTIGDFVTISGTTSLKNTKVLDESLIVGTAIRNSKIGKRVTVKCAGVIENEEVENEGFREFKKRPLLA